MAIIVELPRLSDTMEEGVIAKWHIAEGDKVKRGQLIAEIETDKATMEFESFDAGTVLRLVAPEGETLALGAPIAVLGKPGEDAEAALASRPASSGGAPDPAPAPASTPEPAPPAQAPSGGNGAPAVAVVAAIPEDDRIAASPLARRLARELGVPLGSVAGSGPHGRIVKTDVEAAASAPATTPAFGTATTLGERTFISRPDEPVTLSQMRKTIAKRMSKANAEIPHFYLTASVDMAASVELRTQLKVSLPDTKISFNDLVILATAKALREHPQVNAFWDGQTIVRRGDIHVGVAVAVDEGLVVPVVRFAEQKSLREIAVEVRDLGTRARDKKLLPKEMTGSTLTVSNLGMFGVHEFSAVINPGEGAILAIGAITDEAVVVDGELRPGKRMKATIACDHRVMDGASAAQYLATFQRFLESPLSMLA